MTSSSSTVSVFMSIVLKDKQPYQNTESFFFVFFKDISRIYGNNLERYKIYQYKTLQERPMKK